MSVMTWCEEFLGDYTQCKDDISAVDHSIQKWEGVLKENLEKHNVRFYKRWVCNKPEHNEAEHFISWEKFLFSASNCALCRLHQNCFNCSLMKARGGIPCDQNTHDEFRSPWSSAANSDPLTMIEWLYKTREFLNENRQIDN